jgi:hypothetical protein
VQGASLISPLQFQRDFPLAWQYLQGYESELRARDNRKNDADDRWWGYVYPKNIDKQHLPKLALPRLVIELFCSIDRAGRICLDNVDVGGVLFRDEVDLLYVAPLPIPNASSDQKRRIGLQALELTGLYTQFRQLREDIDHRLEVCDREKRSEDWLLPTVGSIEDWKRRAPEMAARLRTQWAKEKRSRQLSEELASLQTRLSSLTRIQPHVANGELSIEANGIVVVDHVFVSADEGAFLLAQWRFYLWKLQTGSTPTASKLVDLLRSVKVSGNAVLKAQVVELAEQAYAVRHRIEAVEQELNERIAELYRLTPDERTLIATV